jgi:uncharacterized membrane protein
MHETFLAASLFLVSHVALAENPCRAWLIARCGQRVHTLLYSLLSLGLIWWLSAAVARARVIDLWPHIDALRWLPVLVMPLALFLVVCGISQNNPSSIFARQMAPAAMTRRDLRGILTITRNPVMWGLGLWALSHGLASNQAAELLRFAGFAALALLGTLRIDRKTAATWGEAEWTAFASRSSNLPFLAILQGRVQLDWRSIGWARPLVTLLLYALIVSQHQVWFGMPISAFR